MGEQEAHGNSSASGQVRPCRAAICRQRLPFPHKLLLPPTSTPPQYPQSNTRKRQHPSPFITPQVPATHWICAAQGPWVGEVCGSGKITWTGQSRGEPEPFGSREIDRYTNYWGFLEATVDIPPPRMDTLRAAQQAQGKDHQSETAPAQKSEANVPAVAFGETGSLR